MSPMLERLEVAGNNISDYLNLFEQDEETCEMLTSMFLQDTEYAEYMDSYNIKDYAKCREHIHTIKGTAANIGLTLLSHVAAEIMHCIDNGEFDRVDSLTDTLSSTYDSTISLIKG